jgi:hypothetical protein
LPHSPQNFAAGESSVPHEPQTTTSRAPHSSQNFARSLLLLLQFGHFISRPPSARFLR